MFDSNVEWVPKNLELIPPGAVLAAMLDDMDLEMCSDHDRVRVLQAQERMKAHYQAKSYQSMSAIADIMSKRVDDSDDETFFEAAADAASAEIAAALHLTRRCADSEMALALELQRRLPAVAQALSNGDIDLRRARVLVNGTLQLSVAAARDVVVRVLDQAPQLTTGQLHAQLRRLCISVDPDGAKDRFQIAVDNRRVVVEATSEGTANLLAIDAPPDKVVAAKKRLTRLAMRRKRKGDARTMDQLRADILMDLVNGSATEAAGPNTEVGLGMVGIQADLATLTRLSEDPGELDGYGPVVADITRQIVRNQHRAEWRWTLIDPDTKLPIDGGITRRRPTTAQQRLVQARNRTCIHPGCRMPSMECDLDHRVPWSEDQQTDANNLAPLCRYHHRIRHQAGWSYEPIRRVGSCEDQLEPRPWQGDFLFTTALNHQYTTSGRSP
jgi:hypothetical protein